MTFSVSGFVARQDRVLVGPETGGGLNKSQLTLLTTLVAVETVAVMNAAIPSDTPTNGTIRIVNDGGYDRFIEYSSFTGSTFTFTTSQNFAGTLENGAATAGNNVYITYLDKLASTSTETFTVVFNASRNLFVRVRDGGATPIKTFETTGTLGAAGGSTTVIRTTDA